MVKIGMFAQNAGSSPHRNEIESPPEYIHYECDCAEFKEGNHQLMMFTELAFTHGLKYTAPTWKFCAWCGKKLKKVVTHGTH